MKEKEKTACNCPPNFEDYATIETICDNGVPVYSFNNIAYVYGESPDFNPGSVMQDGNNNPVSKIKLKKSWEIKHNFAGAEHEMTPKTAVNNSQPMLPLHLIDGNPETVWCSWGCYAPDAYPEWIRVDLPAESIISEVALVCNKKYMGRNDNYGNALPSELEIKISRDAWHWDIIYSDKNVDLDAERVSAVLSEPAPAKQIMITGNNFTKTVRFLEHVFSIGGVEVKDTAGNNLALLSRGAGISVSSVSYGVTGDKYTQDSLWGPLQYDLGNKWVRAGGDNGSYMWAYTEHEKGKLEVDERFDEAVTEAVRNGVNVILDLDFFGNWIYADPPRKTDWATARFTEWNDLYNDYPPRVDSSPEMFEAFLDYADYMVGRFKDRVAIFEIGNEWNCCAGLDINWCVNKLYKPVYERIKKSHPEVKLALCSIAEQYPAHRPLNALGYGAFIKDGKFTAQGRTLTAAKNIDEKNISVSVDASSQAQTGIVLRYKSESSYILAMYDRQNKKIYIDEVDRAHNFILFEFECLSEKAAEDMGENVHLEASVDGDAVTFTVSDGEKTVSVSHEITKITESGKAGVILSPSRPQPLILEGEFNNFKTSVDNVYFDNNDNWDILWNYWGDGTKTRLASSVDGIGWHPIEWNARCSADGTPMDADYFEHVRLFKKDCEALGFKGLYSANEIYVGAIYPASGPYEGKTDMQMAKYLMRTLVGHNSLSVESGPCHPHFNSFPHPQALCRVPAPVQTVNPCQPTPSYYTWRNVATAMDDFYEAEFPVEFSNGGDNPGTVYFTLESGDKSSLMVAAFLDVPASDSVTEMKTNIMIMAENIKSANVTDVFNGTWQELNIKTSGGIVNIENILIKDYPLLIILKRE